MMAEIPLDKASLIALVLETFNLGMFTVMGGATLRVIFQRRFANNSPLMLSTLALIWLLSIVHWIIDIVRATNAFLNSPLGALAYYADVSNPLQAAKTAVYVTLTLAGDFFVIYRCHVVWGRNWLIVGLPILLWLGTGAVGYATTHAFLQTHQGGIFLTRLKPLVTGFICMTLATNVVCTILIAYRILKTRMRLHKANAGSSRVYSALIIFLESAATYSAALIALVVVYGMNSNAQFIVLDLTAPLIGITFSMIILRLAMGDSSQTNSRNASGSFPLRVAAVNVSRLVEVQADYGTESFDRNESGKPDRYEHPK